MKNQVQLITYVDRFGGGGLAELQALLTGPLNGVFGGVHLLPFYDPIDGADAGFDPTDHTRVDARLGTWADVRSLAQHLDVMADVIVNHVSSASPQFLDYSEKGNASAHRGLFLSLDTVFPGGATEADLLAVYRPRPGLPFASVQLANRQKKLLWCTFTPQQLDIDVTDPQGQAYLTSVLQALADGGVTMIRLDAVGYAIKKAGMSCFMMPETFAFIDALAAQARALGMEVLVEVHSHHGKQIEIARRVDWVYDFALPPLVLHAFCLGTAVRLKHWIGIRPHNAITVLDTHDGIGVIDIGADASDPGSGAALPGLVPPNEIDQLVRHIHSESRGQSAAATGAAASNLDLYQVNCTFYDALGRDDTRYFLARAVQFFLPGVPQVYYVGLLAGANDMDLLAETGIGRDINRHRYGHDELIGELARPVVQRLIALIRLRNAHPAFGGKFTLEASEDSSLAMRWDRGSDWALLVVDFENATHELVHSPLNGLAELPPQA